MDPMRRQRKMEQEKNNYKGEYFHGYGSERQDMEPEAYEKAKKSENGNSTQFMSEEMPRALSQREMEMIEARIAQCNERLAEKCMETIHGINRIHGNF